MSSTEQQEIALAMQRNTLKLCALAIACGMTGCSAVAQNTPARPLDIHFLSTPQVVVGRMLEIAKVNKGACIRHGGRVAT
jgi:hypothetical protein